MKLPGQTVHDTVERLSIFALIKMLLLIIILILVIVFGSLTLVQLKNTCQLSDTTDREIDELVQKVDAAEKNSLAGVPNLFALLMQDHITQTVRYLADARMPCDRSEGEQLVTDLKLNMGAWAGALLTAGAPSLQSTTDLLWPHIAAAKQLIDSSFPCPCSAEGFFAACNDKASVDAAIEHLQSNTGPWVAYLAGIVHKPADLLRPGWEAHLACTVDYISKAVAHDNAGFNKATIDCLNKGRDWAKGL
jgi:hypothetical protein